MTHEVVVTFTETVTRRLTFDLDIGDVEPDELECYECSDMHELLDRQNAWDQVAAAAWLGGEIEDRSVDSFEIAGLEEVVT